MAKQRFYDRAWWQAAIAGVFGTVEGIVFTFGVTHIQQRAEQKEMARKVTRITLRNLDVRIDLMEREIEILKSKENLYNQISDYFPDRINEIHSDSIQLFVDLIGQNIYTMTDSKAESIFSTSFEVWQYLDDEKVIGRISNCYSIIDFHSDLIREINSDINRAFRECFNEWTVSETTPVLSIMRNTDLRLTMERIPATIELLENTTRVAKQLNARNKEAMGISDKELEEIGNLLDINKYEIGTTTK